MVKLVRASRAGITSSSCEHTNPLLSSPSFAFSSRPRYPYRSLFRKFSILTDFFLILQVAYPLARSVTFLA